MAYAGKRILVTGAAGFLGSHLCERLLEEGHHVLGVDNYYTGCRENIQHLLNSPFFEIMRHDVTLPLFVEVDQIYNLASPASPIHYQFDPVQTTKTNVHGAINMLGLAKRTRSQIFQASTSEVYGDPYVHPQTEAYWGNVNPIGPRACYDEAKRCAETLFFDYYRQHNLRIKVCRIFNTYGPRMHPNDGRVVSSFIVQALKNEPITIFGEGSQTRSFCYVDDLVEGILRFMNTPRRDHRTHEFRQSRRIYDPRTGGKGHRYYRIPLQARLSPPPFGRPQAETTRHFKSQGMDQVGTDSTLGCRVETDHQVFSNLAR